MHGWKLKRTAYYNGSANNCNDDDVATCFRYTMPKKSQERTKHHDMRMCCSRRYAFAVTYPSSLLSMAGDGGAVAVEVVGAFVGVGTGKRVGTLTGTEVGAGTGILVGLDGV
jgi:hypothetical protein